jgi:hypothetical protein
MTDSVFAMEMFVRVMKWCGDYPVGGTNLFNSIVDMVQKVMYEQPLADELYCQIWKQLSGNPDAASEQKAWELLAILSGLVRPSAALLLALEEFCSMQSSDTPFKKFSDHIRKMFSSVYARRKFACSIKEMMSVSNARPITLSISLPLQPNRVIHVHPHSAVGEINIILARECKIQNYLDGYGLFGTLEGAEGPLDSQGLICDVMTQWSRSPEAKKLFNRSDLLSLSLEELEDFQPALAFRKIFFDEELTEASLKQDPSATQFLYDQCLSDIKNSELVLSKDLCIKVVAYYARIHGNDQSTGAPNTSRGPTPMNPILIAGRGRGAGLVRPPTAGGRGTARRSSSGNDMEKDILGAMSLGPPPNGGAMMAALSNDEIKRELVVELFPFNFVEEFWADNEMGNRGAYGML